MSLHKDMQDPLTALARVRVLLAMDPAQRSNADRLGAILACLEDVAQRVAILDRCPVPEHWLPQREASAEDLAQGTVVSLAARRAHRQATRAVRL